MRKRDLKPLKTQKGALARYKANRKKLRPKEPEKIAAKQVRKVNRDAYTFRPDVLLTVGVDVANGRVLITEVKASRPWVKIEHFDTLHKQIEHAAHSFCIKERIRLGVYVKECRHPIGRRRYVKGTTLCTKCGKEIV